MLASRLLAGGVWTVDTCVRRHQRGLRVFGEKRMHPTLRRVLFPLSCRQRFDPPRTLAEILSERSSKFGISLTGVLRRTHAAYSPANRAPGHPPRIHGLDLPPLGHRLVGCAVACGGWGASDTTAAAVV